MSTRSAHQRTRRLRRGIIAGSAASALAVAAVAGCAQAESTDSGSATTSDGMAQTPTSSDAGQLSTGSGAAHASSHGS